MVFHKRMVLYKLLLSEEITHLFQYLEIESVFLGRESGGNLILFTILLIWSVVNLTYGITAIGTCAGRVSMLWGLALADECIWLAWCHEDENYLPAKLMTVQFSFEIPGSLTVTAATHTRQSSERTPYRANWALKTWFTTIHETSAISQTLTRDISGRLVYTSDSTDGSPD